MLCTRSDCPKLFLSSLFNAPPPPEHLLNLHISKCNAWYIVPQGLLKFYPPSPPPPPSYISLHYKFHLEYSWISKLGSWFSRSVNENWQLKSHQRKNLRHLPLMNWIWPVILHLKLQTSLGDLYRLYPRKRDGGNQSRFFLNPTLTA